MREREREKEKYERDSTRVTYRTHILYYACRSSIVLALNLCYAC